MTTKTKIAAIGSSSMVGSRFCEQVTSDLEIIRADLNGQFPTDITKPDSVNNFFKNHNFSQVILFSAYTDVDSAEQQREDKNGLCWQINVEGVRNVVESCQKHQRKLIFISTDFVFDGTRGPYSENNPVGPDLKKVSWYGISKIEAEKAVKQNLKDYLILRISYPYRARFSEKDDIAKRILRLYQGNELYPMFTDQYFTPTFIDDLAPAIKLLIAKDQKGTFHVASPIPTTQFEFATYLLLVFGAQSGSLAKGSILDFLNLPNVTPRPVNGGLKVDKIKDLGFTPTSWREGIQKIYQQSDGRLI